MTAKQNLGHFAHRIAFPFATGRQLDGFEAGDGAAVNAQEMRMSVLMFIAGLDRFKSPNVISQLRPAKQAAFSQVVKIAKRGRFIEALRSEPIG